MLIKKKLLKALTTCLLLGLSTASTMGFFSIEVPKSTERNYLLNPNETQEVTVNVKNTGNEPVTLNVYGVDGSVNSTGGLTLKLKSSPQIGLGKWIEFKQETVTVQPKETTPVSFKITVPDKTTPGDYPGGVAFESIFLPTENSSTPNSGGRSNARIAVKFLVTIPGEKITKLDLTTFNHYESDAFHNFDITYKNSGNTLLQMSQELFINNESSEELSSKNIVVLPGEETSVNLRWAKKDLFKPLSTATFLGRLLNIKSPLYGTFAVKLNYDYSVFDINSNSYTTAGTESSELSFSVFPWKEIFLVLSLVALVLISIYFRKIYFMYLLSRCSTYTVQEGDTLTSLAKETGWRWKTLAKVNKLEEPYEIHVGDQILLPKKKTTQ
jgi:hypothetical protein